MFGGFFAAKEEDIALDLDIKSNDILVMRAKFTNTNMLQMRQNFPGVPDETLAQYLIARNNELPKAIEQLTKALKWKAENFPILKSSCLKEISSGKLYIHGVDKEGRPLLIYRACKSNPTERDLQESIRMLVWFGLHLQKKFPAGMSKYTLLIDRSDFNSSNTDQELMKVGSPIFQDLFPETVAKVVIFPCDVFYYALWNVVKWFIDPVTREKVNPMMMLSGVESVIDREYIPKAMGGDCDYEYSADHFDDPYTPEELAQYDLSKTAAKVATAPDTPEVAVAVPAADKEN